MKSHSKHHFMQAVRDKGAGQHCGAYQNLMRVVARLVKQHAAAKHITLKQAALSSGSYHRLGAQDCENLTH